MAEKARTFVPPPRGFAAINVCDKNILAIYNKSRNIEPHGQRQVTGRMCPDQYLANEVMGE